MMEWFLSCSVLILMFALLRRIVKGRISLRLQYALWALVLLRLLIPWNPVKSDISVLNVTKEPEVRSFVETVQEPIRFESREHVTNEENGASWLVTNTYFIADSENLNDFLSVEDILLRIWGLGCLTLACFMLTSNRRFLNALSKNRKELNVEGIPLPVYVTDKAETPCLAGFFHPAIYLTPDSMEQERLRYILEHELTHYRHKDHILSVLRCTALALHWYNPLVWWAAKASKQDGELACDEGTLALLGEGERIAYGRTLLDMTCVAGKNNIMLTATTMTGGKRSLKERIQLIAKKPRMAVYTLVAVILIMAVVVGCTFTGAQQGSEKAQLSNGELLQLLQEEQESEQIAQILAALAEKTDLHRGEGWIRKYDEDESGSGYQLPKDRLEAVPKVFSGYAWERCPDDEPFIQERIFMELELEYTDGTPIRILMQSDSRLMYRDLLRVCWYIGDEHNMESANSCIFRAVPKEGTKLVIYGALLKLFDEQSEETDGIAEETSVRGETAAHYFRPMLEQTEESNAIIQMLRDMISNTKDSGTASIRLLHEGQAYVLDLDETRLDDISEYWKRYIWEETEVVKNPDSSGNVMALRLEYTQGERFVVHIGAWEDPYEMVRIIWPPRSENESEVIRCFTASPVDENTPPTMFDALNLTFQNQELAFKQNMEEGSEEFGGEEFNFLGRVSQVMKENDAAFIRAYDSSSPILEYMITQEQKGYYDKLKDILEQYHWTMDIRENHSLNPVRMEIFFGDGTILTFSPDTPFAYLLPANGNRWYRWEGVAAEEGTQRIYQAVSDLWKEMLMEEYSEHKSDKIADLLYSEIIAMEERAQMYSRYDRDMGPVTLGEVWNQFCAEHLNAFQWVEVNASIFVKQDHYEDYLLEGNECSIRFYGNQDLIEYTRDGQSRYFYRIPTEFSDYLKLQTIFYGARANGGISFAGVSGHQAAEKVLEMLPQLLESLYGDKTGLRAEDVKLLGAQWTPDEHDDTIIDYDVQLSVPKKIYEAMDLKDTKVEQEEDQIILDLDFYLEGANENFWVFDYLYLENDRLVPH